MLSQELQRKAQAALELIAGAVKGQDPVVYSSFGKDSMVMLDLVKRVGLKLPVIFHREAFGGRRYEFADMVIRLEEYAVHDWPPAAMEFRSKGDVHEIVNRHVGGRLAYDYLPIGIREPEFGKPYLCGLADLYGKPLAANHTFPWNLGLIGLKSTDLDPILGAVQLTVDAEEDPVCPYLFPLRHFTDADIWTYTEFYQLPINLGRYDRYNGWKEFHDITYNPDYLHACVACMVEGQSSTVYCPQKGRDIPRVAALIDRCGVPRPAYFAAEGEAIHGL